MQNFCIGLVLTFLSVSTFSQGIVGTNSRGSLVPQTEVLNDVQLAQRVREQLLLKVPTYSAMKYNVFSQGGQITIQGSADNLEEADAILSAARTTPGIRSVVNGITTKENFPTRSKRE
jgi:osmotically-inducible protein OsmY